MTVRTARRLSVMSVVTLLALGAARAHEPSTDPVDFGRDVRPILSDKCFACHGPDEETREADLRLDVSKSAYKVFQGAAAITPGSLEDSLVYWRIISEEDYEVMPPPESGKPLTAEEIDVLKRWIEQGADYQTHWSYEPPTRSAVPAVENAGWPVNPIDAFIVAGHEQNNLTPSPEADRRTLLRRVTYDLTGLPPTPEELQAFLDDDLPGAYERVVDRLLASDAYAERMTLAWMDAARYGDTSVFHADGPRDMWPWRDWVIRAYHDNMPFDRFTIEQLAGDQIPNATLDQQIASGFLRNNGTTDEGGVIAEEYRVEYAVDRVKTTANVWMGLTMECGQCHDHKYDPITQKEYYGFYAFFNQSSDPGMQSRNGNEKPLVQAPTGKQERELARLEQKTARLEKALKEMQPPQEALYAWISAEQTALAELERPEASPWWFVGPFEADTSKEAFQTEFGPEAFVRQENLDLEAPIGGLNWKLQDNWPDGSVHLFEGASNSAHYIYRTLTVEHATKQELSLGSDDTIQVWLNGELVLAKEVYRGTQPDQDRIVLDLVPGVNRFLMKVCNGGGPTGFYFKLTGPPLPEAVIAALQSEDCHRDVHKRELLRDHFVRNEWPDGQTLVAELTTFQKQLDDVKKSIPTVMVMRDLPEGRMTYVLNRGQYDAPREDQPVIPTTPSFLPPMPTDVPANRLGLALWLTDPSHPLTARVTVNRYWAMLFGRGLVGTVTDFGSQGQWPTHPELLDWLAVDFMDSGWNVKRMLRQMVMSATYRQSSRVTEELQRVDPQNRLLARSPRFRLQGEFIRDTALMISGLLVDQVGGPGVKPYQPAGLWNEVSLDKNVRFVQDAGEKLYRKSMYTYWKRSAPAPAMTIFDAPTREKCVVQRQRTNTPLQALVTLNDVQFVEAARGFAERVLKEGGDTFEARLDRALILATGRPADAVRREVLRDLFDGMHAKYTAEPEAAAALLASGESPRDESLDLARHAAWTLVCSTILNLDETLNRE